MAISPPGHDTKNKVGVRPNLAGKRFLIIEDEPLVALDVMSSLDEAGVESVGPVGSASEALALIVRSGEGLLRRTRNLCLSSLIEAVRDQTRIVDLKQVNRVLIQPHWRKDCDNPL